MTKKSETKEGKNQMNPLSVGFKEAEKITGLSRRTFERMIKKGKIRAARVGSRTLIPVEELERITRPGANTEV